VGTDEEEAEEARRRRFAGGWPSSTKLVVILSEDVEHERARAFVGSIVDGTAIVTIRDLSTLNKSSHDVIYFCRANVAFNVLEGETRPIRSGRGIAGLLGPVSPPGLLSGLQRLLEIRACG
jgi:hypothetical protein